MIYEGSMFGLHVADSGSRSEHLCWAEKVFKDENFRIKLGIKFQSHFNLNASRWKFQVETWSRFHLLSFEMISISFHI